MAISTIPSTGISSVSATTVSSGTLPFAQLPAGSVLQVVTGDTNTETGNSTTTYADTTLTATITPKFSTSKILVIADQNDVYGQGTSVGIKLQLVRNSTNILAFGGYVAYYSTQDIGSVSCSYLDSPATTSATTYKTQFAQRASGASPVYVQNGGASRSTITLMEIAQ
jgi:hypothetical protein